MSHKHPTPHAGQPKDDRRRFLNKVAYTGLAGAGVSFGLAACKDDIATSAAATTVTVTHADKSGAHGGDYSVAPGQLDTYYMFSSAGHAGDVRIFGLPSGREFKRIPVFNIDCMIGWGITNESKAIIGTNPDGTVKYNTGDTHHLHPSYTDGTYDGRYLFVNDKLNCRLARVRGATRSATPGLSALDRQPDRAARPGDQARAMVGRQAIIDGLPSFGQRPQDRFT